MKMDYAANGLTLRRDIAEGKELHPAYGRLMCSVFGPDFMPAARAGSWRPIAFFARDGQCVSGLEVGLLPLFLDGAMRTAAAIRSVATEPAWRGRGLSGALMREALAACETWAPAATLLYTATPARYERFGFRTQPQHAFVGVTPMPTSRRPARYLDLDDPRDRERVVDLVTKRAPVSRSCALLADPTLFIANVARDDALKLAYVEDHEALVVFECDADELLIVDVVAPRMPTLAMVISALDPGPSRLKCLFPPDELDWFGEAEPEETGLMIRGPAPPALRHPFMFSPTSEF